MAFLFSCSAIELGPRLFSQQRFDPGDFTPHLTHLGRVLHAPRGPLEAQLEELLGEFSLARVQLVDALLSQLRCVVRLHSGTSSISRLTKRVLMGSLWAARRNASSAIWRVTPSISYRMRAGLITATHSSGAPLPWPMRVSSSFLV